MTTYEYMIRKKIVPENKAANRIDLNDSKTSFHGLKAENVDMTKLEGAESPPSEEKEIEE